MDSSAVADHLALRDLVDGYAAAADSRDELAFASLFLADATLRARRGDGEPAVYSGHDRLAEIPRRLSRYPLTFHVVTNHRFEVDGDTARGGALCQAHHVTVEEAGSSDLVLTIRYDDTYARTADGWRFATREVHILWTTEGPVSVS